MKEYSMLRHLMTSNGTEEEDLNKATLLFITQLHLRTACENVSYNIIASLHDLKSRYELARFTDMILFSISSSKQEKVNYSRCQDQGDAADSGGENLTSVNCSSLASIAHYCLFFSAESISINGTLLIGAQQFSSDLYTPWLRQFLMTMSLDETTAALLWAILQESGWDCTISPYRLASCTRLDQADE